MAAAPKAELVFGPMLIGTFLNMILYGILIAQMYHYYQTYKQDANWIRYFILYLFIVETLNTGCDIATMFQPLIGKFGQPSALTDFPTMLSAQPIICVCVSTPIQLFFAWRIRVLTKNNILTLIISFFSLVSLAGGVWTTALIIHIKLFSLKPQLHWPALLWFLASVVADVLIASILVFSLSNRRTRFTGTDDAIQKIIRMTVQTGLLTAFCAIADVVLFMTLPHTALNFVWDLALVKIYANCLMSSLNARSGLADTVASYGNSAPKYVSSSDNHREDIFLEISAPPHVLYEHDTQKSSIPSDVEYCIKVTKVVETRQDPAVLNHVTYQ